MYVSEIILKNIPVVHEQTRVHEALSIVTQYQLTHVIVVEDKQMLGLLTEEFLWSMDEDASMNEAKDHFEKFALHVDHQILDTFKLFRQYDTNVIPVVNDKNEYQGAALMEEVATAFSKYTFLEENGAILEIEVSYENYSMEEISRIVESNNAKLYGAILTEMDTDKVRVTLKMTTDNISSVGATFERFGYAVRHKYYEDKKDQLMEERYKQFQKYINP